MKKITLWSIISVLAIGILAVSIWWLRRPQVVTLSDGTKLTLVGVTYGRHHVAPKIKVAGGRARNGSRIDSTNDTVVVWIEAEHKPNQYPNYQLMVYDKADTACVSAWTRTQSQIKNGVDIQGFMLDAYPRRDRKTVLRVMTYGPRGQQTAKGQFVISNPSHGKTFPTWTPDPLPDTQSDGDLDVTLNKFVVNAPLPYVRNGMPKNDPADKCVQLDLDVQQKGQSATNWRPVQVETTDATGNYIKGWVNDYRQNGEKDGYFYQPGLWPNEPAWKVRLEFSRTAGFSAGELWSVTDIPVRAGNQQDVQSFWSWGNQDSGKTKTAFAETTINGVHVKLFPAIQYTGQNRGNGGNGKVVSIIFKTDPDVESAGMRMTPLTVTDDQGHKLNNQGTSWGGGNYQYEFAEPRNIGSVNVTIALHKSRFVEFTVKPEKAGDANAP
jgi:hypothetical protein